MDGNLFITVINSTKPLKMVESPVSGCNDFRGNVCTADGDVHRATKPVTFYRSAVACPPRFSNRFDIKGNLTLQRAVSGYHGERSVWVRREIQRTGVNR